MASSVFDIGAGEIKITATAAHNDPLFALQDALNETLRAMVQSGWGPHQLTAMQWRTPAAAVLHPSRRATDRAWREVFAGFRPPLTLLADGAEGEVEVTAIARRPAAATSPDAVYQGYDVATLARQMSPRSQVADMLSMFRRWSMEGEAARRALPPSRAALDLRYGPHRENLLDLYLPQGITKPPVWVFIHGGYWQASCREQHAQYFDGLLNAGFSVANIDYPLAPETPLEKIVDHVREALAFIVREGDALGIDGTRLHVAGHSAGGHLAAMMAADPQAPPIASALLLSGIFDVAALRPIPMGPVLGLSSDKICAGLSPMFMAKREGVRIGVALGAQESDEFKRQSQEIARRWHAPDVLLAKDAHHFNLLDGLNGGALLDLALATAR